MVPDPTRIVLIAKADEDRVFYREYLRAHPTVAVEEYTGFNRFREESEGKLFSGFVVDIRTLIRSTPREKFFFYTLLESFPVIRVKRNPDGRTLSGFVESLDLGRLKDRALLEAFIQDVCKTSPPRGIRFDSRRTIYVSAYLGLSKDFMDQDAEPEKVMLENISEGGGFIVTNARLQQGSGVWLVIPEMEDTTPIECQIRWLRPWGTHTRYLPGLGVSFLGMTDAQKEHLEKMFKVGRKPAQD